MVALDILLQPSRLSSNVMSGSGRIKITDMLSNLSFYFRQTEQHDVSDNLQTPCADFVHSVFFGVPIIILFRGTAVLEVNNVDRRYALTEERHMVVIAHGRRTIRKFL